MAKKFNNKQGTKGNKNEKGNSKSSDRSNSKDTNRKTRSDMDREYHNHPSWLDRNPELVEASGRIAFNTRLGKSYLVKSEGYSTVEGVTTKDTITVDLANPSLAAIYYLPTVGTSEDKTSAINLAASQMAAYIRTKISGNRSYDPSDLMIHILGLSSIVDAINIARRAYGIASYYNAWDVSAPSDYLEAMGFEASSVLNNMAKFNGYINQATLKVSTLAIPSTIPYLLRHDALSASVFCDGEMVHRAQKYMFVPAAFHKFNPIYNERGGGLETVEWVNTDLNTHHTIDEWFELVNDLISVYINDADCWTIDGDIRKAYEGNLITMSTIGFDYMVTPVYDKDISTQFENMTMLRPGEFYDQLPHFDISQSADTEVGILAKPQFVYGPEEIDGKVGPNDMSTTDCIINFHWMDPTPLDVAYATQMTTLGHYTKNGNISDEKPYHYMFQIDACQTEVVIGMVMIGNNTGNTIYTTMSDTYFNLVGVANLTSFDWHPTVYILKIERDGPSSFTKSINGEIIDKDNWTVVDKDLIDSLHEVALLSYFNVPQR